VDIPLANLEADSGQRRHFAEIHVNVFQLEQGVIRFDGCGSPHWQILPFLILKYEANSFH
jgi:hypothetical protein